MNQALVQDVVAEVMRRLGPRMEGASSKPGIPAGEDAPANEGKRIEAEAHPHRVTVPTGQFGIFDKVDDCVNAATEAQKKLMKLSLDDRDAIVKLVKKMAKDNAQAWGKMEFDETQIGRLDHKIEKLQILELVPGVEFLKTNAISGSNGVCLEEYAPFGVIGIITPVTHSVPTLSANVINMVASGNSIVANCHPSGVNCAAYAVREYNKAIAAKFGIENLVTVILPPTLRTAEEIFQHRGIPLLVVTGGPAVARAALASKKRAIVAGPGNPPVVVDETACLTTAAESIVKGAAYDNNLLCIGEKQVFAVEAIFDKLMQKMEQHGGFILNAGQIEALTKKEFTIGE
jgi:aldehyde dehydrogenase